MCGVAGLGFHALYKAIYLFWVITGPLVYEDTRHVDYLGIGLWSAGFLVCGGGVFWLLNLSRDYKDRVLTDEEEMS